MNPQYKAYSGVDILLPIEDRAVEVVMLDPNDIGFTAMPNRDLCSLKNKSYHELQASIRHLGTNTEPIKVRRPIYGNPTDEAATAKRFEVISGHRRLQACLELNLRVKAIVVDSLSDKQLLIERIAENIGRADFTPFELGRICCVALDKGMFGSQKSLAIEMGIDESLVSKAIVIARLPVQVIDAFVNSGEIQYRHAKLLKDAVEDNLDAVMAEAAAIKDVPGPPSVDTVVRRLTAAATASGVEPFNPDTKPVPILRNGQPFGTFSVDSKGRIRIAIPSGLRADQMKSLRVAIEAHWNVPTPSRAHRKPKGAANTAGDTAASPQPRGD